MPVSGLQTRNRLFSLRNFINFKFIPRGLPRAHYAWGFQRGAGVSSSLVAVRADLFRAGEIIVEGFNNKIKIV